jgi:hypothetical protein
MCLHKQGIKTLERKGGKKKGLKSDDGMVLNEMGNNPSLSKGPHKTMNDS